MEILKMLLSSRSNKLISQNKKLFIIASLIFGSLISSNSFAKQYNFIVQPVHSPEKMKQIYQPLVNYLNKETGHTFNVVTSTSFISYWAKMKKGQFDLILDAAHFTDYRIKRMNYSVLAKIPNTESFSIITNAKEHITDYKKLIGKKLITLPSPSLSSMRLAQMFPNPARQPNISSTNSTEVAIKSVQQGTYFAALVPTSMLSKIKDINTVNTTIATPHMAISASPKITKELQNKIRVALIKASTTTSGKAMLSAINIPSFKATNAKTYQGYEKLLASVWDY
jgi:phosphonate transport system substrate-binding protein